VEEAHRLRDLILRSIACGGPPGRRFNRIHRRKNPDQRRKSFSQTKRNGGPARAS
jgi:hypothetical protein